MKISGKNVVDLCVEVAYEVNQTSWILRQEAKFLIQRKQEACIDTILNFERRYEKLCPKFEVYKADSEFRVSSWIEVLGSNSRDTPTPQERLETFNKAENKIWNCAEIENSVFSSAVQWHGILLVLALFIFFVGLLFRGKTVNETEDEATEISLDN